MLDNTSDPFENSAAYRLRRARINAGYHSARDFCIKNGITIHTYYSHERGHRAINAEVAAQYAALLKVSPSALLYGSSLRDTVPVPIVGTIGDQGHVTMLDDPRGTTANLAEIADMESLEVQGNALYPAYREGDLVYCKPLKTENLDVRVLHGCECIVMLENGTRMLRQIFVQPDHRVTLNGYNVPPILNVAIVAASPVEYVKRALPRGFG